MVGKGRTFILCAHFFIAFFLLYKYGGGEGKGRGDGERRRGKGGGFMRDFGTVRGSKRVFGWSWGLVLCGLFKG